MKILANIAVALFTFFLATPTLVFILSDKDDMQVNVVCSAEEEVYKDIKEVKAGPGLVFEFNTFTPAIITKGILSENLQRHDNVFGDIFLPPPDVI